MKHKTPQTIKGLPIKRPRNPVARALRQKSGAGRHGPSGKAQRLQAQRALRGELLDTRKM
jgi:hypothetical protein